MTRRLAGTGPAIIGVLVAVLLLGAGVATAASAWLLASIAASVLSALLLLATLRRGDTTSPGSFSSRM